MLTQGCCQDSRVSCAHAFSVSIAGVICKFIFKYYCRVNLLCFVFFQLMENKGTKIMIQGIKNILALKRGFRRSIWTNTEI